MARPPWSRIQRSMFADSLLYTRDLLRSTTLRHDRRSSIRNPPMAIELPDGRSESNDVLDALRLRAVHARELGYAVVDIAAILGVREETVSRWCSRYDQGGQEALPGDRTGRPLGSGRLLTSEQERGIQAAIETKSPEKLGISSALW